MPTLLFPDFLASSDAYAKARRYWEAFWEKVRQEADPAHPWRQPWMTNPTLDGNPIFTAVCEPLRRGVRIIQDAPREPDEVDLDWWIDTFGDAAEPDSIRELVIACCPSQENAAQIERLVRQWVRDGEVPASAA